jgi:hypothetical protein
MKIKKELLCQYQYQEECPKRYQYQEGCSGETLRSLRKTHEWRSITSCFDRTGSKFVHVTCLLIEILNFENRF